MKVDNFKLELKQEINKTDKKIDNVNQHLIDVYLELKGKINNVRTELRNTNKKIDFMMNELSILRKKVREAIETKTIIDDLLVRVERLEAKH